MTTRPRTTGLDALRRQSLRPVYETFAPEVEEREQNEAHILQLQLPDFNPQQIRVKVEESNRTIGVTGDRFMGNNRWFRLDKTYPVPENCIVGKIHHNFENGVLTITMPKEGAADAAAAAAAADPPPKEAEQRTPDTSQDETERPEPKAAGAEVKQPEEAVDTAATPPPKGAEQLNSLTSQDDTARPELKAAGSESKQPEEAVPKDDSGKASPVEKPLKKLISEKGNEKTPNLEKGREEETKSTPKEQEPDIDKKTENEKPTEKKEINEPIPEKEKEETNEMKDKIPENKVGKNAPENAETVGATPSSTSRAKLMKAAKRTAGFAIGRMPMPLKANLAATLVILAAYLAYSYYRTNTISI